MSRIGEWWGRGREEEVREAPRKDPQEDSRQEDSRQGSGEDPGALRQRVVEALKQVYDPEIPVNIYDLGLIYRLDVGDGGAVTIDMTLTTPGCPVAETFPGMVEYEVGRVEGVRSAAVEIVWDPPWTQDRMTEAAKLELGLW